MLKAVRSGLCNVFSKTSHLHQVSVFSSKRNNKSPSVCQWLHIHILQCRIHTLRWGAGGRSSRPLDKGQGAVSPLPNFFGPPQFVSAFLKRWQGESLSRFSFGFMFSLMLSVSLPKCDSKFFFLCNYVIVMPNRKGTMLLIHLDSQKGFKCTNWQKQN